MGPRPSRTALPLVLLGLAAVLVLAFGFRMIGFERVFLADGDVVFHFADAQYHARRALWTLHDFPRPPFFDPYLNHPEGAWIPYPPLYDFGVAAVAWALGGSRFVFERVAALSPVVLGSLAVLPIWRLGRRIRGDALGLGAAAIYAVLPLPVRYAEVGNCDHHAAVALIGASLLALYAAALDDDARRGSLVRVFVGLAVARASLLLVWQGSLLHLGLGEAAILVHAAWQGRRDLWVAQAASAAATALAVAPVVAASGAPLGGPFSAVELSWLHPTAYLATAVLCAGLAALEARRPAASPGARLARAAGLAALLGSLLVVLPAPRAGLARALEWLGQADSFGGFNFEQRALLSTAGGGSRAFAESMFGWAVYVIPLVPVLLAWEARRRAARAAPAPLLLLAAWSAVTGFLALGQVRYGNDFAPVGALGFALAAAWAGALLGRRLPGPWAPRAIAIAVGLALLLPGFLASHAPGLRRGLQHLRGAAPPRDPTLVSFEGSLHRFAKEVRRSTPPTTGLFDADARPEYAILAPPRVGNALHYVAERATPADNFGPYIGPENFLAARDFFALASEDEALARARRLGARYVVTSSVETREPDGVGGRLHAGDGGARGGRSHLGRFRLVAEGPRGGIAVGATGALLQAEIPYKLFEIVPGAVIELAAAPGELAVARIDLRSPSGRRVRWVGRATAGPDGRVRLRVPYATGDSLPTRAEGPYRLQVGERSLRVEVAEDDVLGGRSLRPDGA